MPKREPTPAESFARLSRRGFLEIGGLGAAGLSLPQLLAQQQAVGGEAGESQGLVGFGKAKRALFIFMWGGPSHLDTWDLKPQAPAEIRGEFNPISTAVPGLQISELLPKLAQHADKLAVVRSMTHTDPAHLSSVHHLTTGHLALRVNSDADAPSRKDSPHIGALMAKLRPTGSELPACVMMPWVVNHPAAPGGVAPGQHAGWLGPAYDPFLIQGDPNARNFRVDGLGLGEALSADRFTQRRELLSLLEQQRVTPDLSRSQANYAGLQQQACDLLTSARVKAAFDIRQESAAMRQTYGRNIHGQCLLLSRRLLEAGVPLVCVNWHNDGHNFWDTHGDNFKQLKNRLCPPADQGFSALLSDLTERGLLDETLIVWVGEFGRRPQITVANAGREHWPWCYSAVLAGGGIRGGQVYGRSDKIGAYPAESPVAPADLTATLHHALGIAGAELLYTPEGRPLPLVSGAPLLPLFG